MFCTLIRKLFIFLLLAAAGVVNADQYDKSLAGYTQKGNFELGGGFGTPSGLNARYWFTERFGLDANAGVSLDKQPVFTFDLLYENYKLYRSSSFEMRFFYGLGCLVLKDDSGYKNNIRIPFGLSFPLMQYPINFSFYIAPALVINPKTEFDINWGIGVRYNFTRAAEIMEKQYHLEREVGKLERDVEGLKQGLDTTKGQLAEKEGELTVTKGKLNELTVKLGNIKNTLDKTEGELGTTKGELGTTKNKLLLTTKELDDTKNQLDSVKSELSNTKKTLDDKQVELNKRQAELDKAKVIIENAYTGKEKEEEEGKTAVKQKELNEQLSQLKNEKKSWEKIKEKEVERRVQLRKKCEDRGGVIDENGYCTCPENQEWDPKTDKCVCMKGYYRNKPFEKCKACETIKESGDCADGNCEDYEEKVKLTKGPHKYVCVKRCRKSNEVWSKGKNACACRDGYYRNESGECAKRQ
jgi:hypothetical protein